MPSLTSNKFRELLLRGEIDPLDDTLKVLLFNTSYVPDKDHSFVASITGGSTKELSGTGYTGGFGGSGRKTLGSKTVTRDDTTDKAFLDAADPTWVGLNAGGVGGAAIIKEVTSDADSPILAIVDLTPDYTSVGNDFTLQWPATGIFEIA